MGSNIAGVILGGLSENLSMVLGFNYLLGVAIVFYLLSWVLKRRVRNDQTRLTNQIPMPQ
jgi:Flp pilus assembly protein TadB